MTTPTAASVWRDYVVDAVPASGPNPPVKADVRAWATSLEAEQAAATSSVAAALTAVAAVAPLPNGLIAAAIPKTGTITLTLGSPGTVNWTAHGLNSLSPIFITTTGALLTGLTAGTTYFVTAGASLTTNAFRLSTTIANAIGGTSVNFTGTQSGTHTAFANYSIPYPYKGYRPAPSVISIAGGFSLTTGSAGQAWNSLVLPAGMWRVWCQSGVIHGTGSPSITHMHSDFGLASSGIQTSPAGGVTTALHITSNNANGWIFPNAEAVHILPAGATIYGIMTADFTGGQLLAYGTLSAELI